MDSIPSTDTREQHFVQMFGDAGAARALARHFAEAMVECAMTMCEEDPTSKVPDAAGLKEMTVDYSTDMLHDFRIILFDEINKLFAQANINIESTRTVKITFE